MPLLIQVCIVVTTIGFVVMEIAVLRSLHQVRQVTLAATRVTDSVERAAQRLDKLAEASHELFESIRDVVAPLRKASGVLGVVGERAAALSADLMDELEPPVNLTTTVSRSVRTGISYLVHRLARRWAAGRRITGEPRAGSGFGRTDPDSG